MEERYQINHKNPLSFSGNKILYDVKLLYKACECWSLVFTVYCCLRLRINHVLLSTSGVCINCVMLSMAGMCIYRISLSTPGFKC